MFTPDLLRDRNVLVTGGGTGLGRAIAERYLELGATVHICGRRLGVCQATAEELDRRHSGRIHPWQLDIRDAAGVAALVDDIWEKSGPLTGLVNNAAGNFVSRTEDLSHRGFDAVANIVAHGSFYVTHAVGRRWIAEGVSGNVVSILVTWVMNGSPYVVPSAMSKAALDVMTKSLAVEWAPHGIRLNAIAPGEIPTEGMSARLRPGEAPGARGAAANPMRRCGTLAELQNCATFLMADGVDWLTGQTLFMDGAAHLANGNNLFELRDWNETDWQNARSASAAADQNDRRARAS